MFLDNNLSTEYITQQFMQLVRQAQRDQAVIAIAHPHPETIAALAQLLPLLSKNNIDLVPVSQLLKQTNGQLRKSDGTSLKSTE